MYSLWRFDSIGNRGTLDIVDSTGELLEMNIQPVMKQFGEPVRTANMPNGKMTLYLSPPFFATQIEGYAPTEMAQEIDMFYQHHFPKVEAIVTIHEWSKLTDYDAGCRRILQQLNQRMREKQKEIVIHLGSADTLGQKVVRATAETMMRFRKIPIEIFSDDAAFETRVSALLVRYRGRYGGATQQPVGTETTF